MNEKFENSTHVAHVDGARRHPAHARAADAGPAGEGQLQARGQAGVQDVVGLFF
jgi:hypothetical protein